MRNFIMMLALASLFFAAVNGPVLAQDADPIAVLSSDASYLEKSEVCRKLALTAGPEVVPALEALLVDEEMAHMARYVLEAMPCPEAGAALRATLPKVSGRLLVGIVNSLEIRQDSEATPALIALLSNEDTLVVQAAASALGVLASPEAVEALESAAKAPEVAPANLKGFCDALCESAEKWAKQGQKKEAQAIYTALVALPNVPPPVLAAALRGAIVISGDSAGAAQLGAALQGDNGALFDAALRSAREIGPDEKVDAVLVEVLPTLSAPQQVLLIQTLGHRGGALAGPALLTAATEGPEEVRIAALRAMTRIGYTPALPLIKDLSCTAEGALAKAARHALSFFPGKEGDDLLLAMLEDEAVEAQLVAIKLIGEGGLNQPVGILMGVAQNNENEVLRIAALKKLAKHGGLNEMPVFLELLLAAPAEKEAKELESLLRTLCARLKRSSSSTVEIVSARFGDLPDGKAKDISNKVREMVAAGAAKIEGTNVNFGDPAPGVRKKLEIEYSNDGVVTKKMVAEGQSITLATTSVPKEIVDAFCAALEKAEGETKLALLRLLGVTGSPKAFATIQSAYNQGEGAYKETALRELCAWSGFDAFPFVLDLYKTSEDPTTKVLALRGVVRLLRSGPVQGDELLEHYAFLMESAKTADDKKLVLSGLAQVHTMPALEMIFQEFSDEAVKAEAVQAAISVAKSFGAAAKEDKSFYDPDAPTEWRGSLAYWHADEGGFVGTSPIDIPRNEFIWSDVVVGDFYLSLNVKLDPPKANAGIQFRSSITNEQGKAKGYQADMGQDVWGRLYHEDGRGKLDWMDYGEKAVKIGDWNHYEILAIGPAIWTAINGTLSVAYLDMAEDAERSGKIAFQVHKGAPQKAIYHINKLVHNPKVELKDNPIEELFQALRLPAQP